MQLAKHPEYAGVRGTITRERRRRPPSVAQLAGDIDDEGLLNIDESLDGRAISGVWLGELQPGSCGKEFKGTWRNASDDSTHPFVLNKTGSLAMKNTRITPLAALLAGLGMAARAGPAGRRSRRARWPTRN